jgi:hypothetical protein
MKNFSALLVIVYLASCTVASNGKKMPGSKGNPLDAFVELMAGTYTSKAQSLKDTSYFNINLVMHPIWKGQSSTERWLYVEQAAANTLEKPYRQRVYKLEYIGNNTYTSEIYTIKNQENFIGLQTSKTKEEQLTLQDIELKEGCTVTLTQKGNAYIGGTEDAKCPSELRGAKYATTKITLQKNKLISWDQGFDATGKQVWGATKGGYIFEKQ